ncbi:MAG: hypothetical protein ACRCXB_25555 [Aeromonadaceae bacterium]
MRLFKSDAYIEVDTDSETIKLDQRDPIYGRRLVVEFDCLLTNSSHPNKGMVRIYNLTESTRRKIVTNGKKVRLYAGYDGNEKLICVGDMMFADSRKEGSEWILEMRFGDGATAFDNATTTISVSDGTSVQTVIDMLARDMGIVLKTAKDALAGVLNGSLSLDGLSKDQLDKFTADHGLTWSIQDEELQVTVANEPIDFEAIVISAATGLLEAPQRLIKPPKPKKIVKSAGESKEKKKVRVKEADAAGDIKFRAQLHPDLRPGKLVKLESVAFSVENSRDKTKQDKPIDTSYNGVYICKNVVFSGDNNGGAFDAIVEADAYNG